PVLSPGTANARSPSDAANVSARAASRTLTTTPAPRSYNRSAAARPRPRAAPVTIATRPLKSSGTPEVLSPPASLGRMMKVQLETREYGGPPERRQMRVRWPLARVRGDPACCLSFRLPNVRPGARTALIAC